MKFSRSGQTFKSLLRRQGAVPLLLLAVSVLAYGLLIPWLHLYIDDWIWHWTWERLGAAGMARYFTTNRPALGWLYQATLPLLYPNILAYHLFALLMRWASALGFWWLLLLLWPQRPHTAAAGALLFLLYPGFALQPIALTYGHIFFTYLLFLLSLCFNLLALERAPLRQRRWFWWFTALGLGFSLANLFLMEYFFTLEAARLLLLWLVVGREPGGAWQRLRRTVLHALPYLLVFGGAVIWRVFLFPFQRYRYEYTLLEQLQSAPLQAFANLAAQVGADLLKVTFGAWLPALERLAQLKLPLASSLLTLLAAAGVLVLVLVMLLAQPAAPRKQPRWAVGALLLGLLSMLTAGWPYWLTGLQVQPLEFGSRFTLPFMFGAVLFWLGLLEWIGSRAVRAALLALALAAAGGYHVQIANDFRLDWQTNRQLFWQLAWRAPDLQPGTLLLLTDFPYFYYNNAAYATEVAALYPKPGDGDSLPYFVMFARNLSMESGGSLPPGMPVQADNVTAQFRGSTAQVIMLEFDQGQCLRLLDQNFDAADASLSEPVRQAAALSDLRWVVVDLPDDTPQTRWFGEEPPRGWCYYFEKAELARQRGNWQAAARLGDEAAAQGLSARDEMEKLVFIEAYAQVGQWHKALEISQGFADEGKRPMLCRLWQRIEQQAAETPDKAAALQVVRERAICP